MTMLWASDVVTPILVGATGNVQGSLLAIGGSAVAIGAVVLGLRAGWRLFKHVVADGSDARRDWSYQSAEYDDEMNATGPDHADYEQSPAEQDAAAKSYLDRYRS